ncbi:MAG TPA: DUF1569 domain-containing protein [Segetibacter sp.]|jgi:hypothetical protein
MKSLFNTGDNNELIQRIERLTPNSPAEWGKMNVAQMLSHVQEPIKIAFGEVKLKQSFIGILFGRMAKKKMLQGEGLTKNLPTAPSFLRKDDRNFEEEKSKLISYVKAFATKGADGITKDTHPFFGKLTTTEWDVLGWKHLDHHLRQFGV